MWYWLDSAARWDSFLLKKKQTLGSVAVLLTNSRTFWWGRGWFCGASATLEFYSMDHKPWQIARNLSKEQIHPLISQQTVNGCFGKQEKEKSRGRRSSRRLWQIPCYFHSHFSSHWICLPVFLAIDFQLNEPATPSTQHAHRLPTFTHHNRSMRHFTQLQLCKKNRPPKKWGKHKKTKATTNNKKQKSKAEKRKLQVFPFKNLYKWKETQTTLFVCEKKWSLT